MIQVITQCGIGLLVGCVLTLAFFPFRRRHSARLTQHEVIAAAPPTASTDIQAEKDQMRAEFVQSIRRLEIGVENIREKALARLGPADKRAAEVNRLQTELDKKAAQIATLREQAEWHKTVARRIVRPLLYVFARTRRDKPAVTAPPVFKFEQGPQWEFKRPPVQNGYAAAPAPAAVRARPAQTDLAVTATFSPKPRPVQTDLAVAGPATPAQSQPAQNDLSTVAAPLTPNPPAVQSDLAATAAAIAAVNLKRRRVMANKV
jgi:hypothetical protein